MFRYFALIWDRRNLAHSFEANRIANTLRSKTVQWRDELCESGFLLMTAGTRQGSLDTHLLAGGRGVVVGRLFRRSRQFLTNISAAVGTLTEEESERIAASQGRLLTREYWGNYVAFVTETDPRTNAKWILKDPTGDLPCLRTCVRGVEVIFSCLADCIELNIVSFSVNWEYVRFRVAGGAYDGRHSSLAEVSQLQRGTAVRVAPGNTQSGRVTAVYWNPLDFSDTNVALREPEVAAMSLRETLQHCTAALVEGHQSVLLRLSGGLDSSIVLSCLKSAECRVALTSYTYYTPGGKSDERRWSALAATHAKCKHLEHPFDPAAVDLEPMLRVSPSMEPPAAMGFIGRGPMERKIAAADSCTAVISGDGGDAVLAGLCVGLAADDYLRVNGLQVELLRVAEHVASYRDITIWTVLGRALRRWFRGSKMSDYSFALVGNRRLVSRDLPNTLQEQSTYPHPWFRDHAKVPWETIRRLGILLLHPQFFYDPFLDPCDWNLENLSPMYAQPVVELCLAIPIYVHFLHGNERGLARYAFERYLPPSILKRQWKDRAPDWFSRVRLRNLPLLRSVLLDGILAQRGMLNRVELERSLTNDLAKGAAMVGELFALLDVEMWIRSLSEKVSRAKAA